MPNMKTVGQRNLKLFGGQAFWSQGPIVLDLWPGDLKINTGHLLIMTNLHAKLKTVGQRNLKFGQAFWSQGPCDLDLRPGGLKIKRGHLLIMTNLHAKYEDCGSKNFKLLGGQEKNDGQPEEQTFQHFGFRGYFLCYFLWFLKGYLPINPLITEWTNCSLLLSLLLYSP
jgi:hypothetical protein